MPGDTTEERPGGFQSLYDITELLSEKRPDEAVAGIGQDDDQGPDQPPPATLRVPEHPETTEVHLCHFARCCVRHADCSVAILAPSSPGNEAAKRSVAHGAMMLLEQLLDAGHPQLVGEPPVDLVSPGTEQAPRGHARRGRPATFS